MRKLALAFLFLMVLIMGGTFAFAAEMDNPQIAEGTYMSSNTIVATTGGQVVISSYPAILHSVTVGQPGFDSSLTMVNSRDTSNIERTIAKIDTSTTTANTASYPPTTLLFDVYCSSGIAINISGNKGANLTLEWRQR